MNRATWRMATLLGLIALIQSAPASAQSAPASAQSAPAEIPARLQSDLGLVPAETADIAAPIATYMKQNGTYATLLAVAKAAVDDNCRAECLTETMGALTHFRQLGASGDVAKQRVFQLITATSGMHMRAQAMHDHVQWMDSHPAANPANHPMMMDHHHSMRGVDH